LIDIRTYIQQALAEAVSDKIRLDRPAELEIPRNAGFGDLSSNVAMHLAKPLKNAPRKIADDIVSRLQLDSKLISKVEIAGAGFINFTYAEDYLREAAANILQEMEHYGSSDIGKGKRVNLEFVSANPTGPLNIVSARAAALGDSLKRLMNFCGYEAKSEFYVNDAGKQIVNLYFSFLIRYAEKLGITGLPFPEGGYHGEYLRSLANSFEIPKNDALEVDWVVTLELNLKKGDYIRFLENLYIYAKKYLLESILSNQQKSLERVNVIFDNWILETKIQERELHIEIKKKLENKAFLFEKDGAIFLKTKDFGDDEDRVIWTSDGRPTYFLPDIAYHQDKYDRGFEWLIDIWGPDHHGYIARMKAALQALGHSPDSFTVIIAQQVNLLRGGEKVKMSKRAGEIVTMDELIDEVGADAARFFFLQRKASAHLDFDLDLAVKQSEENPVFYVQYAHARICSIERFSQEAGINAEHPIWDKLAHPAEFALIRKMTEFPLTVEICVKTLEPQRLTVYLGELASSFHSFYQQCRVVTDDKDLSAARLGLCLAVRQVLKNGLDLLGVSAPEKM